MGTGLALATDVTSALRSCFSLAMDCLYPRDPPQPVREKKAQHPVQRDPAMFNATEVENGPAAREMTYKIQKWNVVSRRVHPILVANARVDWLASQDSELTQNLLGQGFWSASAFGASAALFQTCCMGLCGRLPISFSQINHPVHTGSDSSASYWSSSIVEEIGI